MFSKRKNKSRKNEAENWQKIANKRGGKLSKY